MSDPSPERLKAAAQALYRARAVEGPPGEDGVRSIWHLSREGAELVTLVDREQRVQRQELMLLDDQCSWMSGVGLRTGWVEHVGPGERATLPLVHRDAQPVPGRLLRAALALEDYRGEDRYILHMQRVLALARQGLALSGSLDAARQFPSSSTPPSPGLRSPTPAMSSSPQPTPPSDSHVPSPPPDALEARKRTEGLMMLAVLAVGLVAGIALLFWLA